MAANPIDFDKVWFEFDRLEETKNVVTTVVFCIYGIYLVGLVLARRTDKKDQDKVCYIQSVIMWIRELHLALLISCRAKI